MMPEDTIQTIVLKKLQYCIHQHIDLNMLDEKSLNLDVHIDRVARNLVLRLTLDMWTDELQNTTEKICSPYSWWDHFKRDAIPIFTKWFKLRVKHQTNLVRFKRTALFPKFNQYSHGPKAEFVIHESISFDKEVMEIQEGGD